MGESHSVGLKPRLSVSDFTLKKKKQNREPGFEPNVVHRATWSLPVVLVVAGKTLDGCATHSPYRKLSTSSTSLCV